MFGKTTNIFVTAKKTYINGNVGVLVELFHVNARNQSTNT